MECNGAVVLKGWSPGQQQQPLECARNASSQALPQTFGMRGLEMSPISPPAVLEFKSHWMDIYSRIFGSPELP